jgi:hypothetical protein
VSTSLPELAAEALVLWRVRDYPDHHLCCSVSGQDGELVLMIRQPTAATAIMTEVHASIEPLVERATDLQERYIAAGWEAVDVDLDEPS